MRLINDILNTHQPYQLILNGGSFPISVLQFSTQEALSEPYQLTIDFTSVLKNITPDSVLNIQAKFNVYEQFDALALIYKIAFVEEPNESILPGPTRQTIGVITDFSVLSDSKDEMHYRVVLQPHLSLLGNTQGCAIYQNQSVPEVIEQVLRAHGFLGAYFHFDLQHTYPKREFIVQYKESDLVFIQRIAAEVGIWFRFEMDQQISREVVIFSDAISKYQFGVSLPIAAPSGLFTEGKNAVSDLRFVHKVVEKGVVTKDYNDEDASNPLKQEAALRKADPTLYGEPYHWGDHFFTAGDEQTPDLETGHYFARLHHERYLNQKTRIFGKTTSCQLMPGQVLTLPIDLEAALPVEHTTVESTTAASADGNQVLIVRTTVPLVTRDSHFVMEFEAIPYDTEICFRPPLLPRPVIAGTLPAKISSRKEGDTYAYIDAQGRYRVQFNFDLTEWAKGMESVWLRLAKPYAGATYGFHFPFTEGTEVAVAFVEGNPDRPYIAHAMHDSLHPDLVTQNNHSRNVLRTPANNKIRMEDKRGNEHVVIRTEHGKTQLNLGHLVDSERGARGEGFELRTDNWGTVRAGKGLFISADGQKGAKGNVLDMLSAVDQLTLASSISERLASVASNALTHPTDSEQQTQLQDLLKQLNAAGILLSAPQGIGVVSPESLQLSSGQRNINLTAGQHTEISTLENFLVVAGQAISLLAQRNGINLFANSGKVNIQAQNDTLDISALQDMSLNSVQGKIEINAETEIVLKSGGGYLKIANGNIELGTPHNILFKSVSMQKLGPQSMPPIFPFLPGVINSSVKADGVACSTCAGALAEGNPVNPMLGAKVLIGEIDIALPGEFSFVLSRNYSSYQTDTPAEVGLFGPGWNMAIHTMLSVREEGVILHDNTGRSIKFQPVAIGNMGYSPSENLYLIRGGVQELTSEHLFAQSWQNLPNDMRINPQAYFITQGLNQSWWCFELLTLGEVGVPSSYGKFVLTQLIDTYGRTLRYERAVTGEFQGEITQIRDGMGRVYALTLTKVMSPLNMQGWGQDRGIRLEAIHLIADEHRATLPSLPLARYTYTERGELSAVYDRADNQVRSFEYNLDFLGRMSAHAYAGRPVTQYSYDQIGRVIRQNNPFGISYEFEYHPSKTLVRDQLGRQRVYHFKGERGLKRLVKFEHANRATILNTYDIHGRLISTTDELGRRTEFLLDDETGKILRITEPDGKQTQYEYNRQGLRTAIVLPNGSALQYDYSSKGELRSERDALGHATQYHYTSTGRLHSIEDANGGKKIMVWSPTGQLMRYSDCSGYHTDYEYDEWGQITQIKDEENSRVMRRYNLRGQLVATIDIEEKETGYTYNEAGDLICIHYPDGRAAHYTYDPLGRPLSYKIANQIQYLEYDEVGRLKAFIDELGQRTEFEYDLMDRMISERAFDGREKRAAFNLAGELVYQFDNENLTEHQYDMAGRLINSVTQNAMRTAPIETHYHYDELGQLQQIDQLTEMYDVGVIYQRDAAGRMTQEQQIVKTRAGEMLWQHRVNHQYSSHGVPIQIQIEELPALNWLTYGSGHLLGASMLGQELIEFTRDRLHRETGLAFGLLHQTNQYDSLGRLGSKTHTGIQAFPNLISYDYDSVNQLIGIQQNHQSHQQFAYDGKGRLTRVKQQEAETHYHYDAAGNRAMVPSHMGQREGYSPLILREVQFNRLRQDSQFEYHYDTFGNRIQKTPIPYASNRQLSELPMKTGQQQEYRYDAQHRLVEYTEYHHYQKQSTQYIYDALGRRVGKLHLANDQNTIKEAIWYGWDGNRLVTTQLKTTKVYTIYEPNSFVPLLRFEQPLDADSQGLPKQIHWYYCDHRGAPTALINQQGILEWQVEYDAWGNVLKENNPDHIYQPIRLQGQHHDNESGLYYNFHRYYDPKIGSYITQDPISLQGGSHFYIYPQNPNQAIDPIGLVAVLATAAEGAVIGASGGPLGVAAGASIGFIIGGLLMAGAYFLSRSDNTNTQSTTEEEELTKCLPTTHENIKAAVANSNLYTRQQQVSMPMVARYTSMIEKGSIPPAVKIDGNVIVEGNHRIVAGLLCNTFPPVVPGSQPSNSILYPFSQIEPVIADWGGY